MRPVSEGARGSCFPPECAADRTRPGSAPAGPGIYVHVPFCLAKCPYCDFNSYPCEEGVPDWYLDALGCDIAGEAGLWDERFATVYLGGGTPSLLRPEQAASLLGLLADSFDLEPGAEITLECNPATVSKAGLMAYKAAGVNRISIGVQSLSAQELRVLGRRHNPGEALLALAAASDAGFADVSIDLMLGIPGQTRASLEATLRALVDRVTHVSAYMLALEPGTPLADWAARGLVRGPDDDLVADLYEHAAGILDANGLARYEISNFARQGRACRHNINYWRCGNYVGLGAGAHSHGNGRRYAKVRDPRDYADELAASGRAVEYEERLSSEQRLLEAMMLGLRTSSGIPGDLLGRGPRNECSEPDATVDDLVRRGLLSKKRKSIALSAKGVLLHGAVCAEIARALPSAPVGCPSS